MRSKVIDYDQIPQAATYFEDANAIQCVGCGALAMVGDKVNLAACGPRDDQGRRHLIAMQCDCGTLSLLADDRDQEPLEAQRQEPDAPVI